jgi:hypothetical protein
VAFTELKTARSGEVHAATINDRSSLTDLVDDLGAILGGIVADQIQQHLLLLHVDRNKQDSVLSSLFLSWSRLLRVWKSASWVASPMGQTHFGDDKKNKCVSRELSSLSCPAQAFSFRSLAVLFG